jgi:nucleoside-diphosphate-sugar epimerase
LIPIAPRFLRLLAQLIGKSQAIDRLLGSLEIDSNKAQTLLGWRPLVTMEEQLKLMANNNEKNESAHP